MSRKSLRRASLRLSLALTIGLGAVSAVPVATAQPTQTPPAQESLRFGQAEAPARQAGAVRIATYNVENLFDDKDDPSLSGEQDDLLMTKPEPYRRAAAEAIRRLDADILALQEIESHEALLWFRDEYLAGMGYDHVASIDAGDARGIENAVLSRFPITEAENWPDLPLGGVHPEEWGRGRNWEAGNPIEFRRSPLRVTVRIPGEFGQTDPEAAGKPLPAHEVTLYIVHHKSGGPGAYWREKEAAKIVELVSKEPQRRPVLVLGDFNATPDAASVRTYLNAGFIDAFGRVEESPRTITHESGRRIDMILMNPVAARAFRADEEHGPFVLGVPARPEGADWRTTSPPPGYASDHYPVAADFLLARWPSVQAAQRKPEPGSPRGK